MQPKGDEHPLEEDEGPHPQRARANDGRLQQAHSCLDARPDEHRHAGQGQHGAEREHVHEGRAREDAQPLRQTGVEEAVVQGYDDARDHEGTHHAHVEGLDSRHEREAGGATRLGGEVDAELRTPGA